jgi:hypothetical protein
MNLIVEFTVELALVAVFYANSAGVWDNVELHQVWLLFYLDF